MGKNSIWTSSRAKQDFDVLLEKAKTEGPQRITDSRGSYTLVFEKDQATRTITEFLSKGLPDD